MKSLKYSKELDRFFELLNTEAEPGKTVKWELSGEVPEIVKLEKKLTKEEARIFKVIPFYDVEKPFRVSGFLLKGVPSIVTTIHTQRQATTIKSNLEVLKSDISSLIHKIDTIDSETLPYLEDAVYESIKTVEPVKRGELIMRIKGIFYSYRDHVKPNKKVETLSNDFNIPAGALGNLESLSTKFYTQRDELVKQVREKVGTYHSYLKALNKWDIRDKTPKAKSPSGQKMIDDGTKLKIYNADILKEAKKLIDGKGEKCFSRTGSGNASKYLFETVHNKLKPKGSTRVPSLKTVQNRINEFIEHGEI